MSASSWPLRDMRSGAADLNGGCRDRPYQRAVGIVLEAYAQPGLHGPAL
jgi:hypothetical protein